MTTLARNPGLSSKAAGLIPWLVGATFLLYTIGYVDGAVHGAAVLGQSGAALDYVHEFFHHARHVALMCH